MIELTEHEPEQADPIERMVREQGAAEFEESATRRPAEPEPEPVEQWSPPPPPAPRARPTPSLTRILFNTRTLALVVLLLLAIAPLKLDIAYKFVAQVALIYAFAILSLVVLTGYVGQISLCQGTFVGIAAFSVGFFVQGPMHMNYFVAAILGVVVAFFLGVIVGIPALRLRGIMLAIVTAGVALVFDYYFFEDPQFAWFTGGYSGWNIDNGSLFGYVFDNRPFLHHFVDLPVFGHTDLIKMPTYWLMLAVFGVVSLLMVNLHNSGAGRRFRAIRDSELAASTMGVDLVRYKLLAFGISAAVAGVGGAFFPIVLNSVSPQPFGLFYSLQFAAFGVLMGIRFVPAAALGGFFMSFVPELLSRLPLLTFNLGPLTIHGPNISYYWFSIALGGLLVVQLIAVPDGVWGDLVARARHLRERRSVARAAA